MSKFYASIQGNRGEATRMGSKASGIHGHIRGWNIGASVDCYFDEKTGQDVCVVSITGGSNGHASSKCLGSFTADYLKE